MTRRKTALFVGALLIPATALAGAFAYDAQGIMYGYDDKLASTSIATGGGIGHALDDGGQYFHWYGDDFPTNVQEDIEDAIENGDLTVEFDEKLTQWTRKNAITLGAMTTRLVLCQGDVEDEDFDPSADTDCSCLGGSQEAVVTGFFTGAHEDDTDSCQWTKNVHNVDGALTLSASDIEFDDGSWICLAAEGNVEVSIDLSANCSYGSSHVALSKVQLHIP